MGMNTILMLIAGIVMSTMVASQVAPSIVESIKVKKTQVQTINNQEVIFEAIKRYTTIKQVAPTSIQDLIDAGYLEANVNNNGFGEEYIINVDKALGVATITTKITDTSVQEAFLNSFMGTSKPRRVDATKFETTFVLPNEVMHGNALLMTGIPIQATPPDSNINKYWYDTSSGKATLKLYDGTSWVEVNLGGSGVSIGSIETFAGLENKIPDGYLLCDGREISRTTYKNLFEVIGTTYGIGNGSTTFNIPDLRGKFIRGNGSTIFNSGGYGEITHSSGALGVTQGDTIRNILGFMAGFSYQPGIPMPQVSGAFRNRTSGLDDAYTPINYNVISKLDGIYFDASIVVPTANENRPINTSMNYIIKH